MDITTLQALRSSHPAWRLLQAQNAPLIISFLHRVFLKPNVRQIGESDLQRYLEDDLFRLRREMGAEAFPKPAKAYLTDWADDRSGWLRKRYVDGSDEPRFDLTPAAETSVAFITNLRGRSFIGTESRLRTVFELLRTLIAETETNTEARRADLLKRRAEIDAEIQRLDAGHVPLLDDAVVRDRYHMIVDTAQSLLGDFRALEDNFRALDRDARRHIATWEGSKGDLLDRLFGDRDAIAESDQGRSFKAFYDLLMSADRQDELSRLLDRMLALDVVRRLRPDRRVRRTHYDWLTAAEATQRTVAKLSAELRRYLDDRTWQENRRILGLLRSIEEHAHEIVNDPPGDQFMEIDAMAPEIALPMDRPLFTPPPRFAIEDTHATLAADDAPADELFDLVYVDRVRLETQIRRVLQGQDQITLTALVEQHPLELGLAELITYLSIATDGHTAVIDDATRDTIAWIDATGTERKAIMPRIVFTSHEHTPQSTTSRDAA